MLGGNRKNLVLTTGLGSVVLGMACRAQNARARGWRPGPQQTPEPSPSSLATEGGGRWQPTVMPRTGRPRTGRRSRLLVLSIAPARAVVLTSLIQLVAIAMNLRLRHRRSLRAIERNLADSDPSLTRDSTALRLRSMVRMGWALGVADDPTK